MEKNNLSDSKVNLDDIRLFIAYFEDLTRVSGKTRHKLIKEACLPPSYLSSCKRLLEGKPQRKKSISLKMLIHLAQVHKYPFDLNKYIHLLDLPEEPSK
jgi:hypothetical protein